MFSEQIFWVREYVIIFDVLHYISLTDSGSSGVNESFSVSKGSVLVRYLKLKVGNWVCWLPVLCSGGEGVAGEDCCDDRQQNYAAPV